VNQKKGQISTGLRLPVEKSKRSKKSSQRNAQEHATAQSPKGVRAKDASSKTAPIKQRKSTTAKAQPQKQEFIEGEKAEKETKAMMKKGFTLDCSDIQTPAVKLKRCCECGTMMLIKKKTCELCGAEQ